MSPLFFFAQGIKQLFASTNRKTAERRLMIGRKDLEDLEKSEQQIDQFIERRARQRDAANKEEEFWLEQDRRHRERRREANRKLWIDYYWSMHRVHLGIAEGHARRRSQLLAEGGYEPGEAPGPEAA
jgi:hypothetical protein